MEITPSPIESLDELMFPLIYTWLEANELMRLAKMFPVFHNTARKYLRGSDYGLRYVDSAIAFARKSLLDGHAECVTRGRAVLTGVPRDQQRRDLAARVETHIDTMIKRFSQTDVPKAEWSIPEMLNIVYPMSIHFPEWPQRRLAFIWCASVDSEEMLTLVHSDALTRLARIATANNWLTLKMIAEVSEAACRTLTGETVPVILNTITNLLAVGEQTTSPRKTQFLTAVAAATTSYFPEIVPETYETINMAVLTSDRYASLMRCRVIGDDKPWLQQIWRDPRQFLDEFECRYDDAKPSPASELLAVIHAAMTQNEPTVTLTPEQLAAFAAWQVTDCGCGDDGCDADCDCECH